MADGEAIQRLLSEPVRDRAALQRYGAGDVSQILKDYYLPVVREQLNQSSILLTEVGYAPKRNAEVRISRRDP